MKTKKFIKEVGTDVSGKWMSTDNAELLIKKVVDECILAVKATPFTNTYTTYDLDIARATVEKSVKNINAFMSTDV
jgi:hypothetical protein